MLILAHRGYHAELPENTLAAFEAAVNLGADGIETDVQVTSDGVPVLFHDVAIGDQQVMHLSHGELCRLSGREVPTLVSALDAWTDLFWNLEIKMPSWSDKIWPVLRKYRDKRRLLVSSFWHPFAVEAGREHGIDCGLLVAHRPLSFASLLVGLPETLPKSRIFIVWSCNTSDARLVEEAEANGLKSCVYGPQTLEDYQLLAGWNLAAIITDDPGFARSRRWK